MSDPTGVASASVSTEATTVYDSYVDVLETGNVEALQDYARSVRANARQSQVDDRTRWCRLTS
ncbi:hypothetical protein [Mycobacterium neglectum]|mgnify:CR=1 FL=1|jgi:hypothetical protein|uniref:hypothetical protein n=1 Tax=Mycobacterium neglectum TaxID=242737 RepID=UPI003CCBC42B